MSEEITVKVHSYGPGRPLSLVYIDPISGKKKAKSSKTTDWREAERLGGELEKELRSGNYSPPSKITWEEFRKRYAAEKLAGLSASARSSTGSALNHVERILNPDRLCKMTTAAVSRLVSTWRKEGMKDSTMASHLRSLHAALAWAKRMKMLAATPEMEMPRSGSSKGRPITTEEFDRMLATVPKIRPADPEAWVRYLTGLWLSGLRLEESLILSWDEEAPFAVDLTGRRPAFRIQAGAQKARRDETLPMTPDFAELLLQTPKEDRHGQVFRLTGQQGRLGKQAVSKVICRIGEKAGVVVNKAEGKFASAHDFRRSFGTRWAKRVMPAILQRLMRHASIATTMRYYVGITSDDVADQLWAKWGAGSEAVSQSGNTSGNIQGSGDTGTPVFCGKNEASGKPDSRW